MPPRHRPISSVQALSTSTNQIQDGAVLYQIQDCGAVLSESADSTVEVAAVDVTQPYNACVHPDMHV